MAHDHQWRAMQLGAWYVGLSGWPATLVAGGSLTLGLVALVLLAYVTGDIGAAVLFALMMAALMFYAGLIVHAAAFWLREAWRGLCSIARRLRAYGLQKFRRGRPAT